MTPEERFLRMENALATLSELAARADARNFNMENAIATLSELTARSEARISQSEARVSDLEGYFKTLTELAISASERMDTQQDWINMLGTTQANLEVKMAELAEAQARTEITLNRLSETVERHIEGHNRTP